MYSLIENEEKTMLKFFIKFSLLSGAMIIINVKIRMCQNVIFSKLRKFDTADTEYHSLHCLLPNRGTNCVFDMSPLKCLSIGTVKTIDFPFIPKWKINGF